MGKYFIDEYGKIFWITSSGATVYSKPTDSRAIIEASIFEGSIAGFDIINTGFDYKNPIVILTGGGGSGASARAFVQDGKIVGIQLTNPGTGYTQPPTVVIEERATTTNLPNSFTGALPTDFPIGVVQTNTGGYLFFAGNTPVNGTTQVYLDPALKIPAPNGIQGTIIPESVALGGGATATPTVVDGSVVGALVTNGGSNFIPGLGGIVTFNGTGSGATGYAVVGSNVSDSSNATAFSVINNGSLSDVVLTNGGLGYTTSPVVKVTGGGGTGATVTASFDQNKGVITGFDIQNPGSGYETTPDIEIYDCESGGFGTIAEAAIKDGKVIAVEMIEGGQCYKAAPAVTFITNGGIPVEAIARVAEPPKAVFTGGGGYGASIACLVNPNGNISGFEAHDRGYNYTSAPAVSIKEDNNEVSAQLSVTLERSSDDIRATGFKVESVFVDSSTNGFPGLTAEVTFIGGRSSEFPITSADPFRFARAYAVINNGSVKEVVVTDKGIGYSSKPTAVVNVSRGNGATASAFIEPKTPVRIVWPGAGTGAAAIAQVLSGQVTGVQILSSGRGYDIGKSQHFIIREGYGYGAGTIERIRVEDGGSGYTSVPSVNIYRNSNDDEFKPSYAETFLKNASATAVVVDGKVTEIVVVNKGMGYQNPPLIELLGGTPAVSATIFPLSVKSGDWYPHPSLQWYTIYNSPIPLPVNIDSIRPIENRVKVSNIDEKEQLNKELEYLLENETLPASGTPYKNLVEFSRNSTNPEFEALARTPLTQEIIWNDGRQFPSRVPYPILEPVNEVESYIEGEWRPASTKYKIVGIEWPTNAINSDRYYYSSYPFNLYVELPEPANHATTFRLPSSTETFEFRDALLWPKLISTAPKVTFIGGEGMGATGYAVITGCIDTENERKQPLTLHTSDSSYLSALPTGGVSHVVITNPGTGYTSAPQVRFEFPNYIEARAELDIIKIKNSNEFIGNFGYINDVYVTSRGFGYANPYCAYTLIDDTRTKASLSGIKTSKATINAIPCSVWIDSAGSFPPLELAKKENRTKPLSSYLSWDPLSNQISTFQTLNEKNIANTVTAKFGTIDERVPQVIAKGDCYSPGFIKGITINTPGSGYKNGVVTNVEILKQGYGYIAPPKLVITNPLSGYSITCDTILDKGTPLPTQRPLPEPYGAVTDVILPVNNSNNRNFGAGTIYAIDTTSTSNQDWILETDTFETLTFTLETLDGLGKEAKINSVLSNTIRYNPTVGYNNGGYYKPRYIKTLEIADGGYGYNTEYTIIKNNFNASRFKIATNTYTSPNLGTKVLRSFNENDVFPSYKCVSTTMPIITAGGIGTGATAVANMVPSIWPNRFAIGSITVTNGGSNYSSAPLVKIEAPTYKGAVLRPILQNGKISQIDVLSGGEGYFGKIVLDIAPPAVGQLEKRATATAIAIRGKIFQVVVNNPGMEYKTPPNIVITAQKLDDVNINRQITNIVITNPGSGYDENTTVTIEPPVVNKPIQTESFPTVERFSDIVLYNTLSLGDRANRDPYVQRSYTMFRTSDGKMVLGPKLKLLALKAWAIPILSIIFDNETDRQVIGYVPDMFNINYASTTNISIYLPYPSKEIGDSQSPLSKDVRVSSLWPKTSYAYTTDFARERVPLNYLYAGVDSESGRTWILVNQKITFYDKLPERASFGGNVFIYPLPQTFYDFKLTLETDKQQKIAELSGQEVGVYETYISGNLLYTPASSLSADTQFFLDYSLTIPTTASSFTIGAATSASYDSFYATTVYKDETTLINKLTIEGTTYYLPTPLVTPGSTILYKDRNMSVLAEPLTSFPTNDTVITIDNRGIVDVNFVKNINFTTVNGVYGYNGLREEGLNWQYGYIDEALQLYVNKTWPTSPIYKKYNRINSQTSKYLSFLEYQRTPIGGSTWKYLSKQELLKSSQPIQQKILYAEKNSVAITFPGRLLLEGTYLNSSGLYRELIGTAKTTTETLEARKFRIFEDLLKSNNNHKKVDVRRKLQAIKITKQGINYRNNVKAILLRDPREIQEAKLQILLNSAGASLRYDGTNKQDYSEWGNYATEETDIRSFNVSIPGKNYYFQDEVTIWQQNSAVTFTVSPQLKITGGTLGSPNANGAVLKDSSRPLNIQAAITQWEELKKGRKENPLEPYYLDINEQGQLKNVVLGPRTFTRTGTNYTATIAISCVKLHGNGTMSFEECDYVTSKEYTLEVDSNGIIQDLNLEDQDLWYTYPPLLNIAGDGVGATATTQFELLQPIGNKEGQIINTNIPTDIELFYLRPLIQGVYVYSHEILDALNSQANTPTGEYSEYVKTSRGFQYMSPPSKGPMPFTFETNGIVPFNQSPFPWPVPYTDIKWFTTLPASGANPEIQIPSRLFWEVETVTPNPPSPDPDNPSIPIYFSDLDTCLGYTDTNSTKNFEGIVQFINIDPERPDTFVSVFSSTIGSKTYFVANETHGYRNKTLLAKFGDNMVFHDVNLQYPVNHFAGNDSFSTTIIEMLSSTAPSLGLSRPLYVAKAKIKSKMQSIPVDVTIANGSIQTIVAQVPSINPYFDSIPAVIIEGDGMGATAEAILYQDKTLAYIDVLNGGSGYELSSTVVTLCGEKTYFTRTGLYDVCTFVSGSKKTFIDPDLTIESANEQDIFTTYTTYNYEPNLTIWNNINSKLTWVDLIPIECNWQDYLNKANKSPRQSELSSAIINLGVNNGTIVSLDRSLYYSNALTRRGNYYNINTKIQLVGGLSADPNNPSIPCETCKEAKVTPMIYNGEMYNYVIEDGGYGYVSVPQVTIIGTREYAALGLPKIVKYFHYEPELMNGQTILYYAHDVISYEGVYSRSFNSSWSRINNVIGDNPSLGFRMNLFGEIAANRKGWFNNERSMGIKRIRIVHPGSGYSISTSPSANYEVEVKIRPRANIVLDENLWNLYSQNPLLGDDYVDYLGGQYGKAAAVTGPAGQTLENTGVVAVNILKSGQEYKVSPSVDLRELDSNGIPKTEGRVVRIHVTEPGSGYTSPPLITLESPSVVLSATAQAVINDRGRLSVINVVQPGYGYDPLRLPRVTISAPNLPAGIQAVAYAVIDVALKTLDSVLIDNPGSGYTKPPTVTIDIPPLPEQATAEAVINEQGNLTEIKVTNEGANYVIPPVVTIAPPDNGSGAQARAEIYTPAIAVAEVGLIRKTAWQTNDVGIISWEEVDEDIPPPPYGVLFLPNFDYTSATDINTVLSLTSEVAGVHPNPMNNLYFFKEPLFTTPCLPEAYAKEAFTKLYQLKSFDEWPRAILPTMQLAGSVISYLMTVSLGTKFDGATFAPAYATAMNKLDTLRTSDAQYPIADVGSEWSFFGPITREQAKNLLRPATPVSHPGTPCCDSTTGSNYYPPEGQGAPRCIRNCEGLTDLTKEELDGVLGNVYYNTFDKNPSPYVFERYQGKGVEQSYKGTPTKFYTITSDSRLRIVSVPEISPDCYVEKPKILYSDITCEKGLKSFRDAGGRLVTVKINQGTIEQQWGQFQTITYFYEFTDVDASLETADLASMVENIVKLQPGYVLDVFNEILTEIGAIENVKLFIEKVFEYSTDGEVTANAVARALNEVEIPKEITTALENRIKNYYRSLIERCKAELLYRSGVPRVGVIFGPGTAEELIEEPIPNRYVFPEVGGGGGGGGSEEGGGISVAGSGGGGGGGGGNTTGSGLSGCWAASTRFYGVNCEFSSEREMHGYSCVGPVDFVMPCDGRTYSFGLNQQGWIWACPELVKIGTPGDPSKITIVNSNNNEETVNWYYLKNAGFHTSNPVSFSEPLQQEVYNGVYTGEVADALFKKEYRAKTFTVNGVTRPVTPTPINAVINPSPDKFGRRCHRNGRSSSGIFKDPKLEKSSQNFGAPAGPVALIGNGDGADDAYRIPVPGRLEWESNFTYVKANIITLDVNQETGAVGSSSHNVYVNKRTANQIKLIPDGGIQLELKKLKPGVNPSVPADLSNPLNYEPYIIQGGGNSIGLYIIANYHSNPNEIIEYKKIKFNGDVATFGQTEYAFKSNVSIESYKQNEIKLNDINLPWTSIPVNCSNDLFKAQILFLKDPNLYKGFLFAEKLNEDFPNAGEVGSETEHFLSYIPKFCGIISNNNNIPAQFWYSKHNTLMNTILKFYPLSPDFVGQCKVHLPLESANNEIPQLSLHSHQVYCNPELKLESPTRREEEILLDDFGVKGVNEDSVILPRLMNDYAQETAQEVAPNTYLIKGPVRRDYIGNNGTVESYFLE